MAQNCASIIFAFYQDNITPNPTYVCRVDQIFCKDIGSYG
jgi:hypothetical protein